MVPYGITRPQWVKFCSVFKEWLHSSYLLWLDASICKHSAYDIMWIIFFIDWSIWIKILLMQHVGLKISHDMFQIWSFFKNVEMDKFTGLKLQVDWLTSYLLTDQGSFCVCTQPIRDDVVSHWRGANHKTITDWTLKKWLENVWF